MGWYKEGGLPYLYTQFPEDWKDFRYSVCRTHMWMDKHETMYSVYDAFMAWRNQNMTIIEEPSKDETKVVPFEKPKTRLDILTGGKDGDGTNNWLSDLEEGTVFVSR